MPISGSRSGSRSLGWEVLRFWLLAKRLYIRSLFRWKVAHAQVFPVFEIFLDHIASDVDVSVGVSCFEFDYQNMICIPTEKSP
jgi:hypothetical protein